MSTRRIVFAPDTPTTTADLSTSVSRFGSSASAADDASAAEEAALMRIQPQNVERAAEYHAQRPEPNYTQFRAEFVDARGREYAVARGSDLLEQHDDLKNDTFTTPPPDQRRDTGRLLLWFRIPINLRHSVGPPNSDNEGMMLYHPETQVLCTAMSDGVFIQPRAATGHMFVEKFVSFGKTNAPEVCERWLRLGTDEPGGNWF